MSLMTASVSMSQHDAAASIIAALRSGLPGLTERTVARIRAEIPFYAGQDIVTHDDLHESVRANIDYILAGLTGSATPNLSAPNATGRARAAQGAPLAEMLTAYRVGVAELWSAMAATARDLPGVPASDVIDLAGAVFAVQNTYTDAALAAYRDEARDMLRTQERERAALVEVILAGTAARGTLWEVAGALRLPLDGAFLVVAAETELGHDPIPRAESALAVLDVRSVWRLDAELSLGVLSLPDRARNGAVLTLLGRARDPPGRREPGLRRAAPGQLGARTRPAGARQPPAGHRGDAVPRQPHRPARRRRPACRPRGGPGGARRPARAAGGRA